MLHVLQLPYRFRILEAPSTNQQEVHAFVGEQGARKLQDLQYDQIANSFSHAARAL
jgi:hypothetical protein